MSKPVIALDIDDTLFDLFADIVIWYNAKYGTQLTLTNNHPKGVEALKHWKVSSIEQAVVRVHDFYNTPEFINARPYQQALRVVPLLAERFHLVVVTARDIEVLEEFTHQWLQDYFSGLYREVHFTGQYNLNGKTRTKREVLAQIGANYLIDDSLQNCLEAVSIGAIGLLFGEYPWNNTQEVPAGIMRVRDWHTVEEYFASYV